MEVAASGPAPGEAMSDFEVYGTRFRLWSHYTPIKALGKGAYGVVAACKNTLVRAGCAPRNTRARWCSLLHTLHVRAPASPVHRAYPHPHSHRPAARLR